jgi:hypothetical protein
MNTAKKQVRFLLIAEMKAAHLYNAKCLDDSDPVDIAMLASYVIFVCM